MKIIADTHIWYYLGKDNSLYEKIKDKLISPTFVNIYELSISENIIDKENLSRAAIQMLFKFRNNVIYEPPFVYIAKLHQTYKFDPSVEIGCWLKFTEKFAKGYSIDDLKKEEFRNYIKQIHSGLSSGSEFFNIEAEKIRANVKKNKKEHKKLDTHQITGGFINFCVETLTCGRCNIIGFDLNKIELLVRTLDHFFKTLETSHMKIQDNDWYDFTILAYVQPGDKFWTCENRWINLITDAGCQGYLFNV